MPYGEPFLLPMGRRQLQTLVIGTEGRRATGALGEQQRNAGENQQLSLSEAKIQESKVQESEGSLSYLPFPFPPLLKNLSHLSLYPVI